MNERVLLTGITGYIGQHCAAELIKQGYEVVGTIRSRSKAEATRSALAKVTSIERLSFVEADLLSDVGWDQAMKGCTFVMHVASPFILARPLQGQISWPLPWDGNELFRPPRNFV